MLKGLRVENVRSFEADGWHFSTAALTAFCGTNGAGKSTLLKMPVLLAQSIFASARGSAPQLQFAGGAIDLGGFEALVTDHESERMLGVGIDVPLRLSGNEVGWWLAVASGESPPKRTSGPFEQESEAAVLSALFHFGRNSDTTPDGASSA